ncbi:flavin reductase family protein [Rhizobium leguminosarum]|uniref:flavin reductase family protein n=1 Tax=Rhizobium leguminosarum TaxID=384 RepID=UPI00144102C7|nr:iron-sulfur cluster-binding domain-containing protein [Rhizobium leguminosarum]MBY5868697.1 iron-sulfur cluster-binding domain-containing protein [Rhizobium leguminosarum]NKM08771.1 2Fe-2S iron-sulfur cluster binding domain-containing protein [Rhizobium leguminosarum bv. viciae]
MNEHWIEVVVVCLRQETERVKTFTLSSKEWTLPTWSAGAHIQVRLPSGTVRQYSLMRSRTPNSYDIAVLHEASGRGWAQANLHWEVFAPSSQNDDRVGATNNLFQVELRRSGLFLEVLPSDSVLDVVRRAGIHVESACQKGYCGTCLTAVVEGVPDHRDDDLLSDDERASNRIMTICCSRSCTPKLVLDL